MSLKGSKVNAIIAVSDIDRAREFYEGKLGLEAGPTEPDGGHRYSCGDGTEVHVYPSPHAGKATATVACWGVGDIDQEVGDLSAKGVEFEKYDSPPLVTDDRGIAEFGGDRGAWFLDPDGNTLALLEV